MELLYTKAKWLTAFNPHQWLLPPKELVDMGSLKTEINAMANISRQCMT